jgi:hypothetical protein
MIMPHETVPAAVLTIIVFACLSAGARLEDEGVIAPQAIARGLVESFEMPRSVHGNLLRYVTCSTQQGVGTPSGANERLIGGRALKELIKINRLNIITSVFRKRRNCRKELISIIYHLGD